MRIVLIILALLLAIASAVVAIEQDKKEPGPFDDVPKDHWSYKAVEQLQKHGYVDWYPEDTFCTPKPVLTRYEFAVVIAQVILVMLPDGECAAKIAPGPETKPQKPKADDVKVLEKLANEYRDELAALDVDVDALKRDLVNVNPKPVEKGIIRGRWIEANQPYDVSVGADRWPAGPPYAVAVHPAQNIKVKTLAPFPDIPKNHWAYDAVNQLQKVGILAGYPDGSFSGKKELSRTDFATATMRMITRITSKPSEDLPEEYRQFLLSLEPEIFVTSSDVKKLRRLADEFKNDIVQNGVTPDELKKHLAALNGQVRNERHIPEPVSDKVITATEVKGEKSQQQTPLPFSDVPKGHWAYEAVKQLKEAGILTGYPDGKFEGSKPVTRNDFAVAIAKILPMIKSLSESTSATRQQMDDLERRVSALERGETATKATPTAPPADAPTKAEVESISNLISEFAVELNNMRVNIDALKKDVDALKNRVTAAEKESRPLE